MADQPILGADGNPIIQKAIKMILGHKQFCKIGACEGFKMFMEVYKRDHVTNPLVIMCLTCIHMVRDNDCPAIFVKQNGIVDPKSGMPSKVEEKPDGHRSNSPEA